MNEEKSILPKEWRMHAFFMEHVQFLNEQGGHLLFNVADKEAFEDIRNFERQSEKGDIIITSPLTDLAKALQKVVLSFSIWKIGTMGGAPLPKGNEPGHDGIADENVNIDPETVKIVFDSDKGDMVALESKWDSANIRC